MANWFVRSIAQGSANGTNWSNAWSPSALNASWASVTAGDIIWLAGGNYSTGFISFQKDGAALNYIYIKRATVSDSAATGAPGWDPAFDSQVIFGPSGNTPLQWNSNVGVGSYIYIDGRTQNGISCRYNNNADAFLGAAGWTGGGQHDIVLTNLDLAGPGGAAAFPYQGDNAPLLMRNAVSPIYNITVSRCNVHGAPNMLYSYPNGGNHHITLEYCRFYDNSSSSGIHANVFYNEMGHDWTIRFNDFSGWQVEGIMLWNVGASAVYYIYGNIFHDPASGSPSCFWPGSNALSNDPQGQVFLYNNTFVGVSVTVNQSRSWQFGPGSIARNNIYWDADWAANSVISDSDYNFGNTAPDSIVPGTHSISNGVNPFVSGTDYHIVGTIGATHPRNNGVSLGSSPPLDIDFDGNTRGADGAWDMGAYEFTVVPGGIIRGIPIG